MASFRKSTRITFKSANADGSHSYVLDWDLPDGHHRSEIATITRLPKGGQGGDLAVTQLADDVPERATLVQALEDFDGAGQRLLTIPAAMRPVHLQYMAQHSNGNHRYLLLVSLVDGRQKKYVFEVSEQPGNKVLSPDEFVEDVGANSAKAEPLLSAIRQLYVACSPITRYTNRNIPTT